MIPLAIALATYIVLIAMVLGSIVGIHFWQPPVKLRFWFPAWDKLCCKLGLHRCIPLCRKGCCWECVRCEAEKKGRLHEHYADLRRVLKEQKV